jgi:Epoxide hydrolase N terminus
MSLTLPLLARRRALAIHAVALASGLSLFTHGGHAQATEAVGARASAIQTAAAGQGANADEGIRPFYIHVSEAQLDDLRERIAATRWPDKETVRDESQGIRLAEVQALVSYWGAGYNWHNGEAKLNALPEAPWGPCFRPATAAYAVEVYASRDVHSDLVAGPRLSGDDDGFYCPHPAESEGVPRSRVQRGVADAQLSFS